MDNAFAHHQEIFNKIANLYADSKKLATINVVFGNVITVQPKILAQIWDNWKLFKFVSVRASRFYTHPDLAIGSRQPNDVIIHLAHISVYALMTTKEYSSFASAVCSEKYRDEIYQIILCTERQKVILLCDKDPEFIDKLVRTTEKYTDYRLKIRNDKNQLEIRDKIASNYEDSRMIFEGLTDSLLCKYENIADILHMVAPKKTVCKNRFIELLMSGNFGFDNVPDNWSDVLGTIVIINQNNISGNISGSAINIGSGSAKVVTKATKTEDWVRANPPVERISRDGYYEKYVAENANPTNKNNLGKVLKKVYGEENIVSSRTDGVWHYELRKNKSS